MLAGIKARIHDLIGQNSPELRAYQAVYERCFKSWRAFSTKARLVEAAQAADVVYCGDYHTLHQAQKTNVKILREVVRSRRVCLALECVRARDQPHIDDYMAGRTDEATFLSRLEFERHWSFPWRNYKLFFDFARAHGLRVIGLNFRPPRGSKDKLLRRDAFAAQLVVQALSEPDPPLVWVVYGDLHVAPPHIPTQVRKILGAERPDLRQVVVFQNNKQLYFRLAEQGEVQRVDTVELDEDVFCVLNTPPWVKLQSYLDHLEREVFAADDDEDPAAYEDLVVQRVDELAGLLGVPAPSGDDLKVISGRPAGARIVPPALDREGGLVLASLVESVGAHYFPTARLVLLAKPHANHAAEAAAEYLHHVLSGYGLAGRDAHDRFYLRCLRKAIGFFGSMLLNPKRKTDYFKDHDLFLARFRGRRLPPHRERKRRIARLVVQHQRRMDALLAEGGERLRLRKVYRQDPELGFGVSRALGTIMGDKLYRALAQDLVPQAEVLALMRDPCPPGTAWRLYRTWRARLKAVRKPYQSKDEFF